LSALEGKGGGEYASEKGGGGKAHDRPFFAVKIKGENPTRNGERVKI